MYYISKNSGRAREREAENARKNRMEIVQAVTQGQISKRDLFRWGLLTATGSMALKHGLSQWAPSAYAAVPTGTPRSPTFTATKFSMEMPRLNSKIPTYALTNRGTTDSPAMWGAAGEADAQRYSWHQFFSASGGTQFKNPVTGVGPMEGRPHGDYFAHQRWSELYPTHGHILSLGQVQAGSKFHPGLVEQNANAVWSFGARTPGMAGNINGSRTGSLQAPLLKLRYGDPLVCRIYNDLPNDRSQNGGFGRNEISTHFHNAHNGAESDGACNAYHFPGTFYDYHWGTIMARRDMDPGTLKTGNAAGVWDGKYLPSISGWQQRCSGPDLGSGVTPVPGDFREVQGTMWFHDHRFFFTADNVHKGNYGMVNQYSGIDQGKEDLANGVNLQMPSGTRLAYGNLDFDVNLAITNPAMTQDGQLFFDIFDTDGFLGDILAVNGSYYPYMKVLPRRYRFRILNASMSRFIKLALAINSSSRFAPGTPVPFYFIANDGNFVVSPIKLLALDEQGVAERYDIVIDFSLFSVGDSLRLVNLLQQTNGRKPDGALTMAQALAGSPNDPAVGPILEFRVVNGLESVDDETRPYTAPEPDKSPNFGDADWVLKRKTLTSQLPLETPVRTRTIEFGRAGNGDSRDPITGQCTPDCGDVTQFPWTIRINGQAAHSLNANRIGALIPKPGEIEHWTLVNGGGGWDHPIHLHFEEGITIDRGSLSIPATEKLVRKDVWRLRPAGSVKFQVRFGEMGGAYVNHCHNTVHEDFAMLLRYQLLTPPPGDPNYHGQAQYVPTQTPIPSPSGVTWKVPEILPGANGV